EPFLVWRYGPVVESQYSRFYSYGSSPIIEEYSKESEYEGFNSLIEYYLQVNVFKMVNASHTHNFWKKHESDITFGRSDVPYPLEEVVRD
ncbi:TPA: Panacea domain-containing protein, partial [Streptococcus agalactiae]